MYNNLKHILVNMAAKTIDILTGEYVNLNYEEASGIRRIAACLLDWFIIYFSMGVLILYTDVFIFKHLPEFIFVIILIAPNLIIELITHGKTIGKMLLGIRVINDKCESPDFYQLFLRWLIFPIDFFFVIGTIFMFAKGQRLGDMAGGCRVVYKQSHERRAVDISEEFKFALKKNYTVKYNNANQLSAGEIASINKVLHYKGFSHRRTPVADKVREKLQIKEKASFLGGTSDQSFLQQVVNDYYYLNQFYLQ